MPYTCGTSVKAPCHARVLKSPWWWALYKGWQQWHPMHRAVMPICIKSGFRPPYLENISGGGSPDPWVSHWTQVRTALGKSPTISAITWGRKRDDFAVHRRALEWFWVASQRHFFLQQNLRKPIFLPCQLSTIMRSCESRPRGRMKSGLICLVCYIRSCWCQRVLQFLVTL